MIRPDRMRRAPSPSLLCPEPEAGTIRSLVDRIESASQVRLGRSLTLCHLNAGSCGGCELELRALAGQIYDLERYGLAFAASPRHADVLLVTGPLTRTLRVALEQGWDAMADPKWVVAIGDCAVDGGVFKGSYAVLGGTGSVLPVDLTISGCPPTPPRLLAGLRALVESNARDSSAGSSG